MSEPVTRQRPSVDLADFERRLDASHAAHDDDPLAELARLVGEHRDPYESVFAQEAIARAPQSSGPADRASRDFAAHREPQFSSPRASGPSVDFAAIEAGLRGSFAEREEPAFDPQSYEQASYDQHAQYAGDQYASHHDGHDYPADQAAGYGFQAAAAPRAAGSRRPAYLIAATIAVGVLGVGAAFALKGHGTSPSDVRTIMAAAGPTKIQPPAQDAADPSAQDSAILGKGNQTQPTRVVSNTEEPVDVGAAVQNSAAQASAGNAATDASSVPVPPAPGQADGASAAAPAATDFAMGMPAPKRVKVVSVRPDGTILSDDQPSAAPATSDTAAASPAASAPETDAPAPVAAASTPKASASRPADAPKTASRVMPKHFAAASQTDAATGDDAPAAPTSTHKTKAKTQKLAMAEPTDTAPAAEEPARASGGFAVQLAAPGSEADARSASSKLAHKFASALDGHRLGFHKAQSNGRTVYRVRVSSLSREEAQSLCEKLKADGGTCFVAKN